MKFGRRSVRNLGRVLALLMLVAAAPAACGRKGGTAKHRAAETPAIAAPTPDNTPIPALRTPAGLVLKVEEPGPATPTPPTTPAVTPSPNPTP